MQETLNAVDATVVFKGSLRSEALPEALYEGDFDKCEQAQREKVRVTLSMMYERTRMRIASVSKLRQEKRLSEFRERQTRL